MENVVLPYILTPFWGCLAKHYCVLRTALAKGHIFNGFPIDGRKHITKNRNKEKSIENDILETEIKLKEHRDQEKCTMENKVIDNMKGIPKMLFEYIRR